LDRYLSLVNDASEERISGGTIDPAEEPSRTDDVSARQSAGPDEAEGHVLVVERGEALRNELRSILAEAGWKTKMVGQLDSAIDSLHDDAPSLIISEFRVPSMAAKVLLERLKVDGSDIPVLVTTTHTGENAERLVQKLGAAGYISKPLNSPDVLSRIKGVVGDEQNAAAKT
jgi:DNA-binding response OmpR family regulator